MRLRGGTTPSRSGTSSVGSRIEITRTVNKSLLRCKILLECCGTSTGDFTYDHLLSQGQGDRSPRPTSTPSSSVLLSGSSRARTATALSHADHALDLASRCHYYDSPQLVAKAQLFRDHCFRRMGQWDKAYWCYIRAASVREFAADRGPEGLEALTKECQRRMGRRGRESYYSSVSEEEVSSELYGSNDVTVREERISRHTFGCPDTKFFFERDSIGDAAERSEASWRRSSSTRRDSSISNRPFWVVDEYGRGVRRLTMVPVLRSVEGRRISSQGWLKCTQSCLY